MRDKQASIVFTKASEIKNSLLGLFSKNKDTQKTSIISGKINEDLRNGAYTVLTPPKPIDIKKESLPQLRNVSSGEVRLCFDMARYIKTDIRTGSGRKSVDIGDVVAKNLRGDNLSTLYVKATFYLTELGVNVRSAEIRNRYLHLNPGMQRMNVGNLIRGAMKSAGQDKLPKFGVTMKG